MSTYIKFFIEERDDADDEKWNAVCEVYVHNNSSLRHVLQDLNKLREGLPINASDVVQHEAKKYIEHRIVGSIYHIKLSGLSNEESANMWEASDKPCRLALGINRNTADIRFIWWFL